MRTLNSNFDLKQPVTIVRELFDVIILIKDRLTTAEHTKIQIKLNKKCDGENRSSFRYVHVAKFPQKVVFLSRYQALLYCFVVVHIFSVLFDHRVIVIRLMQHTKDQSIILCVLSAINFIFARSIFF